MNKLTESMRNMEIANEAFTEALMALERNDYKMAVNKADEVLNHSESIEQRAGALFLMTLANATDPLLTAAMLGVMYQVGGNE